MVRSAAKPRVSNHGRRRVAEGPIRVHFHPSRRAPRKSAVADLRIIMPISGKPEIGGALLRMRYEYAEQGSETAGLESSVPLEDQHQLARVGVVELCAGALVEQIGIEAVG